MEILNSISISRKKRQSSGQSKDGKYTVQTQSQSQEHIYPYKLQNFPDTEQPHTTLGHQNNGKQEFRSKRMMTLQAVRSLKVIVHSQYQATVSFNHGHTEHIYSILAQNLAHTPQTTRHDDLSFNYRVFTCLIFSCIF